MGSKSLVYEPVFDDEPRLIVSKNRKLGQIEKETLTIEDFIEEPFLWREQGRGSKDAFETFLKKQGYQENASAGPAGHGLRRFVPQQDVAGPLEVRRPSAARGIVEADDEVRRGNGIEAAFDEVPGRQQVAEADHNIEDRKSVV